MRGEIASEGEQAKGRGIRKAGASPKDGTAGRAAIASLHLEHSMEQEIRLEFRGQASEG